MDINGTRFHLLSGENDWQEQNGIPLRKHRLWWDRQRNFLTLTPKILRFSGPSNPPSLTFADRRGAACDRYGNTFWIGANRQEIRFVPAGATDAGTYWSATRSPAAPGPPDPAVDFRAVEAEPAIEITHLRGLAVTDHQYLVVGTLQPAGLLLFDLHAGGPPTGLRWPRPPASPADAFAPIDMSPAPGGGVWILDGGPENSTPRYWRLDRFFRVAAFGPNGTDESGCPPHDFQPETGADGPATTGVHTPEVSFDHGVRLPLENPTAIEGLADGTVLILERPPEAKFSTVHRFRGKSRLNAVELTGPILAGMLDDPSLAAHDFAFVPDATREPGRVTGELTLVAAHGNQAFVFKLEAAGERLILDLRPRYLPLRRFSGKALIAAAGEVWYDFGERWLPLAVQPRRRYQSLGHVADIVLDGKTPDCTWHRLMLDGCIPEGAGIGIETRTANEMARLAGASWQPEPDAVLRGDGSEIPLHRPFTQAEGRFARTGTWDTLLQNARGRFLELRLTLYGNGQVAPWVRAVRVYYPRFSYLERYLPACYRDPADSADLLDRFLANTEGFLSAIEGRIAGAEALLDVRTAPDEFLEWLAGWVGAEFDPDWDDYRRRLFLSHAMLLYRWRGTHIGMRAAIRLIIEPCPDESLFDELRQPGEYRLGAMGGHSVRIVENFLTRKFPGVVLGDPRELAGPDLLPADAVFQPVDDGRSTDLRFRDFLRRTYGGASERQILDRIGSSWGVRLDSFEQIRFPSERPSNPARARDWVRFLNHEIAVGRPWEPALGAAALHRRFQEFIYRSHRTEFGEDLALDQLNRRWDTDFVRFEEIRFSPVLPAEAAVAEDWLRFTRQSLGFTYHPVTAKHETLYREFLARRYRRLETLNLAYGRLGNQAYASFSEIRLPAEAAFPRSGAPLIDWIQFVSMALPLHRNAHRFTVLIPTVPDEDLDSRRLRLARVEEVVKREKPAHTDFEVGYYWALFQIGGARLGLDTALGEGSRYVALVLGVNYLGRSYLAESHPWDVTDRTVLGRDSLKED